MICGPFESMNGRTAPNARDHLDAHRHRASVVRGCCSDGDGDNRENLRDWADRIVGTGRSGKLEPTAAAKLPYDTIVDSTYLLEPSGDEKVDVIINLFGGDVRSQ